MNVSMRVRKVILAVILIGLLLPPFIGVNGYALQVLNLAFIYSIAALGVTIATGITGMVVLGQAAFMGFGAYTAGAVAAIAFDRPAAAVDGNVERVMTRLFAIEDALPGARPQVRDKVLALLPHDRPGDFAQGLMDLGATICTPRNPACGLCPWREPCRARIEGTQESFPRKAPKKAGITRYGAAFVLTRADRAILLRTRPAKGLLGGMAEVPTSEWRADYELDGAAQDAPLPLRWHRLAEPVRHVFTHFPLELTVFTAEVPPRTAPPAGMRFTPLVALAGEPLPSLMLKVVERAGLAGRKAS